MGTIEGVIGAAPVMYIGVMGGVPPFTYEVTFELIGTAFSYFMLRTITNKTIPAPANKKEYECREIMVMRKL